MPSEPVNIAAVSLSKSPKRLSVRITSNCFGYLTSCIAQLSANICSSSTEVYSFLCKSVTVFLQNNPVSITLDFSADETLFFLNFANSNATLETLSISDVV